MFVSILISAFFFLSLVSNESNSCNIFQWILWNDMQYLSNKKYTTFNYYSMLKWESGQVLALTFSFSFNSNWTFFFGAFLFVCYWILQILVHHNLPKYTTLFLWFSSSFPLFVCLFVYPCLCSALFHSALRISIELCLWS